MIVTNIDAKTKILVVDDEPQITRVLKTTLSSQGYVVRTASNGEDALQELRSWAPTSSLRTCACLKWTV